MTEVLIFVFVLLAALEQTISGFGFSLLVMPVFTMMFGIKVAAPLVALQGVTLYVINLIRYRRRVNIREAINLALAAAVGVPLGIWVLVNVSPQITKLVLGLVLIAYALYNLVQPMTAALGQGGWAYLAGFLSGCLGGAYNAAGPPVVVYGSLRRWPKEEFRAVLQVNFLLTGSLTVFSHFIGQRITPGVLTFYALAFPAQILGILAGSRLDPHVNKERFRLLVTIMILLLGISMIVETLR